MPAKRKADLYDFDPNQSDPDDENFEPGSNDERPRRSRKKQKAGTGRSSQRSSRRRSLNRYRGSDIDEDDEEVSDDSLGEPFEDSDDSNSDDQALPTTATGRRARKAAVKHQSYKESSEEEEEVDSVADSEADRSDDGDDDDGPPKSKKTRNATRAGARAGRAGSTVSPQKPTSVARPSRIIVLKTSPKKLRERLAAAAAAAAAAPAASAPMTRRTRATTEEADGFMELTNSGRHAQPARSSRSRSPESYAAASGLRHTRRSSKGLKKPPAPPIEEATQEDSAAEHDPAGDAVADGYAAAKTDADAELSGDGDGGEEDMLRSSAGGPEQGRTRRRIASYNAVAADDKDDLALDATANHGGDDEDEDGEYKEDAGDDDEEAEEQADVAMNDDEDDADEDEDVDDVQPTGRRTRHARSSGKGGDDADAGDEGGGRGTAGRRLTRGSRLRKAKSLKEPSSDFEPMDDEDSGDGGVSDSDMSQKNNQATTGEDTSSQNSRGRRRSTRLKSGSKRGRAESDDDDVDRDEVAMEAEELRASSRSRPRRRRRSPSIVYEETSRRRTTKVVDYSIKPLDQFLLEQEEEEETVQTPARRRNARGGASSSVWQRNLLSTFGPFGGGGGEGALIGGPWGTGAAGGVDSDSSDDEMNFRTGNAGGGIGGNVGMTPTTGTAPAGFAAPLNLEAITGVAANANVGKVKNHKALADADPLGVDMNVDFSKVGGLQNHINQLKEMVTLPLLYPERFRRFKGTPPRGVLFHGPPGTGKTLLARALANSVGVGGRKITFYMRKGADALSKWVGEAEKQLRLLFEEARRTQPSIIFFDEIDGLAPVRSSKQEQIHASIVSTLLALMDGMDGRGQVIVIGATNRPDNIDPALRRPGRFDREFYFPLPDLEGRRSILDIHTKDWGLADDFKTMLAEGTKGYGGADLRALCTEAALNAIQRTYPQIYSAPEKLVVDPAKISIHATDFLLSMNRMVPSSERSATPAWAPLPKAVAPLLSDQLAKIETLLDDIMPRRKKTTALEEAMFEPLQDADHGFGRENMIQEFERSRTFRPRLLLMGAGGMGQGYLAAAILHHFEGVHIQSFDLPVLLGDGRPLEQVIVGLFVEVKRHKPAVLYLPNIDVWYHSLPPSAYVTFTTMLKTIPPNEPILLLGTSECARDEIPEAVLRDLFGYSTKNRFPLAKPSRESRRAYFYNFLQHATKNPSDFPDPANRKRRVLEELPVAPPPPPRVKTKEELREELRKDHLLLNLLKVQLQPIMDQIKKYKKFRQPVISEAQIAYLWQEADPNYVQPDLPNSEEGPRPFVIAHDKDGVRGLLEKATGKFYYNLDLATIEERLSNGYYARPKDFYADVVSLAKDARNAGDKERLLKANELATNVEVDVAEAEARLAQVNWEELYQRQLRRAREAEEKAARKKAGLAIFGAATGPTAGGLGVSATGGARDDDDDNDDDDALPLVGSDLVGVGGGGEADLSEQQQMQRQARFQLKPVPGSSAARTPPSTTPTSATNGFHAPTHGSNGTSIPSAPGGVGGGGGNDEDVVMTGVGFDGGAVASGAATGPTTAGNTQQVSQVSALTSLPPGVSPSAVANEASTTKSSDASQNRSSGPWTQVTNGYHGGPVAGGAGPAAGAAADGDSQIPDTQSVFGSLPSQTTSSHEWVHSQMHALAKGEFDSGSKSGSGGGHGTGGVGGVGAASAASALASSSPLARQATSQQQSQQPSPVQPLGPPPPPAPATGGTAAAGAVAAAGSGSGGGSRVSSQGFPISVPDATLDPILDTILDRTSGCTVDQLEQIAREIMDYIWATRHERNRSRVLNNLGKVFNKTIADMEEVQGLALSFGQE